MSTKHGPSLPAVGGVSAARLASGGNRAGRNALIATTGGTAPVTCFKKGVRHMPTRSRTTFKKRQKELARMEKQRDKAARRMQRKTMKLAGGLPDLDGESPEGS